MKDSFQLPKSPNSSSEDSQGGQSLGKDSESVTCASDEGVEDCSQGLSAMEEEASTEKGGKKVIVAKILLHPKLPLRSSWRCSRRVCLKTLVSLTRVQDTKSLTKSQLLCCLFGGSLQT